MPFDFRTLDDSIDLLCAALRCSPAELKRVVTKTNECCVASLVKRRRKSSKPRLVWKVKDPLRLIQRQVALWLKPHVDAQDACVTAFRADASPFKNAARHANRPVVMVADLSDFYGSITLVDVAAMFQELGAGRQVALALARLSTIDEQLIQGGRASPFIANLVARRLDLTIQANLVPGCEYTRYVDDLTFSGEQDVMPTADALHRWVKDSGFSLRSGTVTTTKRKDGPYVTGLHVGGTIPRAPRRLRRQIERFLRFAKDFDLPSAAAMTFKHGPRRTDPIAALRYVYGMADWIRPIEPALSADWIARVLKLSPKGVRP